VDNHNSFNFLHGSHYFFYLKKIIWCLATITKICPTCREYIIYVITEPEQYTRINGKQLKNIAIKYIGAEIKQMWAAYGKQ